MNKLAIVLVVVSVMAVGIIAFFLGGMFLGDNFGSQKPKPNLYVADVYSYGGIPVPSPANRLDRCFTVKNNGTSDAHNVTAYVIIKYADGTEVRYDQCGQVDTIKMFGGEGTFYFRWEHRCAGNVTIEIHVTCREGATAQYSYVVYGRDAYPFDTWGEIEITGCLRINSSYVGINVLNTYPDDPERCGEIGQFIQKVYVDAIKMNFTGNTELIGNSSTTLIVNKETFPGVQYTIKVICENGASDTYAWACPQP